MIEHMDKPDAPRVIELAQRAATRQVVIYTPLGFMEQTTDAWGLGGDYWETHRSGWLPEELGDWRTETNLPRGLYSVWEPITRN